MGCGNCGTSANGKPAGCKSNGGCSSGGCNKMNVFDWLSTIPLPGNTKPFSIVEVSFNSGSRKEYFRNQNNYSLNQGQWIAVEGVSGFDMGQVNLTGELVRLQLKKYGIQDISNLKKILRPATEEDIELYHNSKSREKDIMVRSRAIARELKIEMKISEVELQADGKKATFFYTAEQRVDFRELIKIFASDFKIKVEMRQIGARQESAKVGGIGSCGRELCCSTWLSDFKSVNTTAARYQSLSINQTKLSGQCGRLKCCLNYELDTYMDSLRSFPANAEHLLFAQGKANLIKKDIFRNLMWYSFSDSNKQYPFTIERVKEIQELNKKGETPEELQAVELESTSKEKLKIDMGFVNDVGQITLKNLEKKKSKNKNKKNKGKKEEPGIKTASAANNKGPRDNNKAKNNTEEPKEQRQSRNKNVNKNAEKTSAPVNNPNNRPPKNRQKPNKAQPKQENAIQSKNDK